MFHYQNQDLLTNVIVVGAGGTAGRLIPMLAQKLSHGNYREMEPKITIVDGDIVEEKNLSRQNFIPQDVGRNKAEVLAERYSTAFDIPIIGIPRMSDGDLMGEIRSYMSAQSLSDKMIERVTKRPGSTVIFFCVDNMAIRYEILKKLPQGILVIDAGNENTFGQVSVFHSTTAGFSAETKVLLADKLLSDLKKSIPLPVIPCPILHYEQMKEFKGEADLSCAEQEQTGAVNLMMAALQFSIFQSLYDHHKITVGTWFVDIHNGNDQTPLAASWAIDLNGDRRGSFADTMHERVTAAIEDGTLFQI